MLRISPLRKPRNSLDNTLLLDKRRQLNRLVNTLFLLARIGRSIDGSVSNVRTGGKHEGCLLLCGYSRYKVSKLSNSASAVKSVCDLKALLFDSNSVS